VREVLALPVSPMGAPGALGVPSDGETNDI